MRFDFVLNIPSPYRLHTYREVWCQLNERGIEFHMHFMSRGHKERPKSWLNPGIDFPHTYWKDCGVHCHHLNIGLIIHLLFHRPDCLFVGSPFDTFTGILAAFIVRVKSKWCGVEGQTKTPGRLYGIVGWFKRLVLSRFSFVAVPGRDGANYFALHQKMTSLKMPCPVMMPNLIDETRFRPRELWSQNEIGELRSKLSCGDATRLCLIPARLEPVKGIVPFLKLLTKEMLNGWKIVILGQGQLRDVIRMTAIEQGIADVVEILDYVAYDDMPKYYASADLFLLPSLHDPNPLSVPEALHSGLPIALSDRAGNVEEGVTDGENGWRLPVLDRAKYVKVLRDIFSSDMGRLRRMGCVSLKQNAQFWNTKNAVDKFLDAMIASTSVAR